MKEYCVDLDIAKELKENGFPQQSLFYWWKVQGFKQYSLWFLREIPTARKKWSAPTAEELIKELPNKYYWNLKIDLSAISNEYFVHYGLTDKDRAWMKSHMTNDEKLCNALAKLWLYLKKENLL